MLIKPFSMMFKQTGGGGSGITEVQSQPFPDPHPATLPATVALTPNNTGNMIVAVVSWESGGTSFDSSVDTGGGSIPTWDSNPMVPYSVENSSRRHSAIYVLQAGTTSSANFSFNPANGCRGLFIEVFEYSGVDTSTPVNGNISNNTGTADLTLNLTTVDTGGKLIGVITVGDETATVATDTGTQESAGSTGAAGQDIAYNVSSATVVSGGATEGIAWSWTDAGAPNACGSLIELNPA